MKKILHYLSRLQFVLFVVALTGSPKEQSLKENSEMETSFWVFNDKG